MAATKQEEKKATGDSVTQRRSLPQKKGDPFMRGAEREATVLMGTGTEEGTDVVTFDRTVDILWGEVLEVIQEPVEEGEAREQLTRAAATGKPETA